MILRDPLQKRLREMEKESSSPSLRDMRWSPREFFFFLWRYFSGGVERKPDNALFDKAVADESFRQEFLDTLDLGYYGNFIRQVEYHSRSSNRSFFPKKNIMSTIRVSPNTSDIYVYPLAFSMYDFKEFLTTLLDHEGFHAKQLAFSEPRKSTIKERFKREIEAHENEFLVGINRGVSEKFKKDIIRSRDFYKSLINKLRN